MSKKILSFFAILMIIPFAIMFTGCKKNKDNDPESYIITYFLNGGVNNAENPTSYTSESSSITLKEPTKENYEFIGWFSDENFSNIVAGIVKGSTGNKLFYAKWVLKHFTISYELDGGVNNAENPLTYTVESQTKILQDPTKENYVFNGWYTDLTYTEKVYEITQGSAGNRTIYAKWTPKSFDISYETNGGTNNVENPATYTIETPTFTLKDPTRENYDFAGWFLDSSFNNNVTEISVNSTGNKKFYAKWTPKEFDITYVLNGGINSVLNPIKYTIETPTITFANPTRNGYDFAGWYSDSDFNNRVTGINVNSSGNKEFYAKWVGCKYTVEFNYDNADSGNVLTSKQVTYKEAIGELPNPEKTDYEFMGWWYNSTLYTAETIYEFTSGITLTASWKKIEEEIQTFTVKFDTKCDDVIANYTEVEFGSKINKPNDPNKLGYKFKGWHYNGQLWNFENQSITDNITLVADWELEEYTITYVLYDGVNNVNNPNSYTILSDTIVFEKATKADHSFRGWYTDQNFTNSIEQIESGSTGNIIIYANFAIIETNAVSKVSVKFNLPNCVSHLYSDISREIQVYSFFTLPSFTGTNINQYFKGFYYLDDMQNEIQVNQNVIEITSTKELNLYAKWDNEAIDKYYYSDLLELKLDDENTYAYVYRYGGNASTVVIPKYFVVSGNEYEVLNIAENCFGDSIVNKVIVNANKISIGDYAFVNSSVQEFDFSKVVSVGSHAFDGSTLKEVKFGSLLESLSEYAFYNCKNLTLVDFSKIYENLYLLPNYCFAGCEKLTNITLNSFISSIGDYVFKNCTSLTDINFVSGLKESSYLGNYCFENCTSLENVTIPSNITSLGVDIFRGCSNLNTLKLYNLFYKTTSDNFSTYFDIPTIKNVEIIGTYISEIPNMYFYYNENITTVKMSDSVRVIGADAFAYCTNLETIVLSNSLTIDKFNIKSFNGTKWLKNLSEILIIDSVIVYIPANENLTNVVIEDGVTAIAAGASKNNTFLLSLYIPSSVTKIQKDAFDSCSNLKTVVFEENSNLIEIGSSAFDSCNKIESFDLSVCTKLTTIGDRALYRMGKNLTTYFEFTIPNSVTSIGTSAVAGMKVSKFISSGNKYVADERGILFEINEQGEKVKIISYLSTIKEGSYVLPNTVEEICANAFMSNTSLKYVFVSSNIYIGENAFQYSGNAVIILIDCLSPNYASTNNNAKSYSIVELLEGYTVEYQDEEVNITLSEVVVKGYYFIKNNEKTYMIYVDAQNNVTKIVDITELNVV